jgi:hypothetical protein
MRFVFDPGNFPSIFAWAHNAPKIDNRTRRRITGLQAGVIPSRRQIKRPLGDRNFANGNCHA